MKPDRLPQQFEERISREKDNTLKFGHLQKEADKAVRRGEFEYALQLYERAFEVARNIHNRKLECDALIDLGSVADNLGQTDFAIKRLSEALQIAKETRNSRAESTISGKLAILWMKKHRPDLAAKYFEQAEEAADRARLTSIKNKVQKTDAISHRNVRKLKASPITVSAKKLSKQIEQEKHRRTSLRRVIFIAGALLIFTIASIITYIVSNSSISTTGSIALIAVIVGILVFIAILMFLTRIFFSSPRED